MTALPRSASQAWHWDNRTRGITIIVPLVDFTKTNGATQLLVGSHDMTWPLLLQQGAQVAECPAGGIAAFDSRTYHRGLGNETNEARPALILCYDRKVSPPPGCGGMELRAHAAFATVLNVVSAGWAACSLPWSRGE